MAKEKRFVKLMEESQGLTSAVSIYVDSETGVHYLMVQSGYGAGLTPLLDEHGAPVIDKEEKKKKNPWRTMDE